MRIRVMLVMILLALAAAGCAPAAAPTAEPTAVEPAPATAAAPTAEPTAEPTPTTPPQPTATTPPEPTATTAAAGAPAGAAVYKIVPGESTAQYEVGETFINQDNRFNVAIGVSPAVAGEITFDPAAPQQAALGPITVDISKFQSDSSRRDGALRDRFIESAKYPTVTFVAKEISGLPASYTPGQEVSFTISGDLTIRETTRPATFQVTAKLDGGTLTGVATTTILMSDFGFGPISIAGILGTEDQVKFTLNLVARP